MMRFKLYSRVSDHETIIETWGGSTKHPDTVYLYSEFEKTPLADENHPIQIFQWFCEIASRQYFPIHAIGVIEYARHALMEYMTEPDYERLIKAF